MPRPNRSKGLGVLFGPQKLRAVGAATNPAVVRALLALTPTGSLPSAETMADKPGIDPLQVPPDVIAKCIRALPRGRATGVDHLSYELIQGTFEAGARKGWTSFFTAFGAGALGGADATTGDPGGHGGENARAP